MLGVLKCNYTNRGVHWVMGLGLELNVLWNDCILYCIVHKKTAAVTYYMTYRLVQSEKKKSLLTTMARGYHQDCARF